MESSIDEVDADHALVDGVARVHHDVGRKDEKEESNATPENAHSLILQTMASLRFSLFYMSPLNYERTALH
jgi:hypothetical protein